MTAALDQEFGFHDVPTEQDSLEISSYIEGITAFISKCPTPMTIAVQGHWGTGKTSAMWQIENTVRSLGNFRCIRFNTWQYSQFDLGESLTLSLLNAIAEGLAQGSQSKNNQKITRFRNTAMSMAKAIGSRALPGILQAAGLGLVGKAIQTGFDAAEFYKELEAVQPDLITQLSTLRREFEAAVESTGEKIVVFVDDLDRLEPRRAIEVMEAVKVFLDVPNCIFVLAIDFDVVSLGVAQKYGNEVSTRKARSFFDKIIQVPFHMPVAKYKMGKIFEEGLKQANIAKDDTDFDIYLALSAASVGSNPRSTKRLLNTFLLLKTVLEAESKQHKDGEAQYNYLQVFGALCLQSAFPDFYESINRDPRDEGPAGVFKEFVFELEKNTFSVRAGWSLEMDEVPMLKSFVAELRKIYMEGNTFNDEAFNKSIAHSAITSTSTNNEQATKRVRTTDPDERRRRMADRTAPHWIDFAERFEKKFTETTGVFAAQKNPEFWTIYGESNGPRIGLLSFQKSQLKVTLEFRTENPERLQEVQSALENSPAKFEVKKNDQKNGAYSELQILKLSTGNQIENLAEVLRPLYF